MGSLQHRSTRTNAHLSVLNASYQPGSEFGSVLGALHVSGCANVLVARALVPEMVMTFGSAP
jgi:hypothetical protein